MNPQFEYVYGKDDDRRMPPTRLKKAYGLTFDPPLKADAAMKLMVRANKVSTDFISKITAANKAVKEVIEAEAEPRMRKFAEATVWHMLELHRENTGEHIVIVRMDEDIGKQTTATACKTKAATKDAVDDKKSTIVNKCKHSKQHKELVKEHQATKGGLPPNDLNRAHMVSACEKFVADRFKQVGKTRKALVATPDQLWASARESLPFLPSGWKSALLPTLVAEGWVLSETADRKLNVLPYGKGVPGVSDTVKTEETDHPFWGTC